MQILRRQFIRVNPAKFTFMKTRLNNGAYLGRSTDRIPISKFICSFLCLKIFAKLTSAEAGIFIHLILPFLSKQKVGSFIIYCFPKINLRIFMQINYSQSYTKMEEMRTISSVRYIFRSKILINQIM